MIKRFFHNLDCGKVKYLLISGQAAVLYGAAVFSEDIDIWVSPEAGNWKRFAGVLKKSGAEIYKLTPPFDDRYIRKGHGFHFVFPPDSGKTTWFLDVMGVVPRAGSFSKARESAVLHKTPWGTIPVVGIRALVELKKTRRLQDYETISNLARIECGRLADSARAGDWKWILSNSFDIDDILYCLGNNRKAVEVCKNQRRKCLRYCLKIIKFPGREKKYFSSASKALALEIEELRQKDRDYWRGIIRELKDLNKEGGLMERGRQGW